MPKGQRPCTCDNLPPPDVVFPPRGESPYCYPCWLWHFSSRHRVFWGGDPLPAEVDRGRRG